MGSVSIENNSADGGQLDAADLAAYARHRLTQLGRRYYPFAIGAAFLAMVAGFFPSFSPVSTLGYEGSSGFASASGDLAHQPSPGTVGGQQSGGASASGTGFSLGSPGYASTYSGAGGGSLPGASSTAGFGAIGSTLTRTGSSSSPGGFASSGAPSGSGGSSAPSCPLPQPPSSIPSTVSGLLATLCGELGSTVPAGTVPAAGGGSAPTLAVPAPASSSSTSPLGSSRSVASSVGRSDWIGAFEEVGPAVVGSDTPAWFGRLWGHPPTLRTPADEPKTLVEIGLSAGSVVPGQLDSELSALDRDGVVTAVVLMAPVSPGTAPAVFAAWARSAASRLGAADVFAVATGVPFGSGPPVLGEPLAVVAGVDSLDALPASQRRPVGLWWPDDATTSTDRGLWQALANGFAAAGHFLGRSSQFVSTITLGAASCDGDPGLRQVLRSAGEPADVPVLAQAAPWAAPPGATGSLSCVAHAVLQTGESVVGLAATTRFRPLGAAR